MHCNTPAVQTPQPSHTHCNARGRPPPPVSACLQLHLNVGSIMALSWTADGTQVAGAGGSGAVVFGQVVDMTLEDGKMQVGGRAGRRQRRQQREALQPCRP